MLLHQGTLHLSRAQPPRISRALDGTLVLTLLAIDSHADSPQPYLLVYTGERAAGFVKTNSAQLVEGAKLKVDLTNLRMHRSGQPAVSHLVADVLSLQVLPKATRVHYKQKAARPCGA